MAKKKQDHRSLSALIKVTTAALFALAIRQELRKPADERTWHGSLFGWLPYDFRRPTLQRVRDTFWAPDNPKVVMPRVYGIGWDLNVGRLVALAGRCRKDGGRSPRPRPCSA